MNFIESLIQLIPLNDNQSVKVIFTAAIILFVWVINRFISLVVSKKVDEESLQYSWKKVSFYISSIIALIIIGRIWLQGLQPLITFLSIVAAALTITQKESLMNMMGSLLILWRDLFVVGDRIEVGHFRGDVIGYGIFYFSIMEIGSLEDGEQSTGRIIKVPNGMVLTNAICNYTKSFSYIWHELQITISQDSDWEKAKALLLEIAQKRTQSIQEEAHRAIKRIPKDEVIVLGELSPIVYFKQKNDIPTGFVLQLRFFCSPKKRRDLQQAILEEALRKFAKEDEIYLVNMGPLDQDKK